MSGPSKFLSFSKLPSSSNLSATLLEKTETKPALAHSNSVETRLFTDTPPKASSAPHLKPQEVESKPNPFFTAPGSWTSANPVQGPATQTMEERAVENTTTTSCCYDFCHCTMDCCTVDCCTVDCSTVHCPDVSCCDALASCCDALASCCDALGSINC